MSNPADARRRWFGLFFLFIAIGLLVWGQTVLKPHLDGWAFIGYWLVCFGFTIMALLTALLDFWIVRHRTREQHRELLEKAWGKINRQAAKSEEDPRDESQLRKPG